MEIASVEISVKGRAANVPAVQLDGRLIFATGGWLRTARVKDEDWLVGEAVPDPESCLSKLRQAKLDVDIFTFAQKVPNIAPTFEYPMEQDNVAAILTSDYNHWWNSLPQEARKNVRRAARRGLIIREIEFSDDLIEGIVRINNETRVRQGRPFWHYGKSIDIVRKEYSSFPDRSEYIGAFFEGEMIGFIKMVYMGDVAGILQILSMNRHYEKRPANALIARAVEICAAKGLSHLLYGKFVYGNNAKSPLTEFKRRNGFEQLIIPRYYVPLTAKGKICLHLGLHHGIKQLLPERVLEIARAVRARRTQESLSQDAEPER